MHPRTVSRTLQALREVPGLVDAVKAQADGPPSGMSCWEWKGPLGRSETVPIFYPDGWEDPLPADCILWMDMFGPVGPDEALTPNRDICQSRRCINPLHRLLIDRHKCPVPSKKSFSSDAAARGSHAAQKSARHGVTVTTYRCRCGAFHLTSR